MRALKDCLPDLNEDEFKNAVVSSFGEVFGVRLLLSGPSEDERLLAEEFLHQKYLLPDWNFRR